MERVIQWTNNYLPDNKIGFDSTSSKESDSTAG